MPQLPLLNRIHTDSSQSVEFKSIITQFADGYSQRAPDGLNPKIQTLEIKWVALTTAEKDAVIAVLDSVGSWDVLLYQPPTEAVTKKFIIDPGSGYSIEYIGMRFTVSTTLKQVFDL